MFHAADCEFQGNHDLYRDLTQVLVEGAVAGFGVAFDVKAHRELFPEVPDGYPYLKCLFDLVSTIHKQAVTFNERVLDRRDHGPAIDGLHVTLDRRKRGSGNAITLYNLIGQEQGWDRPSLLGATLAFGSRSNPRIQMADLVAREAMKDLDRLTTGKPAAPRRSKQALDGADKFRWIQHDRSYCERWLASMESLHADSGIYPDEYANWLKKTGRVQSGIPHDNWGNRLDYYVYVQAQRQGM